MEQQQLSKCVCVHVVYVLSVSVCELSTSIWHGTFLLVAGISFIFILTNEQKKKVH